MNVHNTGQIKLAVNMHVSVSASGWYGILMFLRKVYPFCLVHECVLKKYMLKKAFNRYVL